jgi:hypothetical protein
MHINYDVDLGKQSYCADVSHCTVLALVDRDLPKNLSETVCERQCPVNLSHLCLLAIMPVYYVAAGCSNTYLRMASSCIDFWLILNIGKSGRQKCDWPERSRTRRGLRCTRRSAASISSCRVSTINSTTGIRIHGNLHKFEGIFHSRNEVFPRQKNHTAERCFC